MGAWQDGSIMSYEIKRDCGVSNHCLILYCYMMGEPNNVKRGIFCMNKKHLNNPIAIVEMTKLWNGLKEKLFFLLKLHKTLGYYKVFYKRKVKEREMLENSMKSQFDVAQRGLQVDPNNEENKTKMDKALDQLKKFEEKKMYDLNRKSRVKWLEKGHETIKELFVSFKKHGSHSLITELEDDEGRNISSTLEIGEQCKEFYAKLYARQAIGDNNKEAKEAFLNYLKGQILVLMKRRLDVPITEEELWFTLEVMVKGKPPRSNGVIVEFSFCMWPIIGKEYTRMIQDSFMKGNFPPRVTRRLITLLHKGGKKKQLFNWKPITLLNVTYKIFVKTFQMQMQLVLMEAISQDQSTFLPFRFILNNILLIHETITWVKKSKQPLVFLQLNFSKAYDKIHWRFLFNCMDKLEIPTEFVKMTKVFF